MLRNAFIEQPFLVDGNSSATAQCVLHASRLIFTYHFSLALWRNQCHLARLPTHKNVEVRGLTKPCRSQSGSGAYREPYRSSFNSLDRVTLRVPVEYEVIQVRSSIWM